MSDAERIREFAHTHFIIPAMKIGMTRFEIDASTIHMAMKFDKQNFPNICQALSGKKFTQKHGLRLMNIKGPSASSTTVFEYEILRAEANEKVAKTQKTETVKPKLKIVRSKLN